MDDILTVRLLGIVVMKKQGEFLTSSTVSLLNLDRRVKRYFGFCRYYYGFKALIPWRVGGEFLWTRVTLCQRMRKPPLRKAMWQTMRP